MLRPSGCLATSAHADDFDRLAFDRKTNAGSRIDDGITDRWVLQFDGGVTQAADQELALMRVGRVIAAGKCVERRDAVHQAVFQEKIQSPVNGGRRSTTTVFFTEHCKDVVGTQRLVALPDQFQHAAAQCGQAQTLLCAQRFSFGEGRMHAVRMIMGATGQGSIGHEQRRYWLETLLCYLFLAYMSDSSAPSFQSCCCFLGQPADHRPCPGRGSGADQYQAIAADCSGCAGRRGQARGAFAARCFPPQLRAAPIRRTARGGSRVALLDRPGHGNLSAARHQKPHTAFGGCAIAAGHAFASLWRRQRLA
ncbi:Zinc ABC transporter, periplasmic zinc-binding protein [Pseudomonas syringae pv. apii]|nr:Zinc ABC transporter, periplasmic zinc-binding protein [Pseudomonas syringae pv. apii]